MVSNESGWGKGPRDEGCAEGTGPTQPDAPAPPSQPRTASEPTILSSPDAMRADEIARARMFYRVIVGVVALVLAALPLLGGDATAKWVFAAGLTVYLVGMTWFTRVIRKPGGYTKRNLFIVGTIGVAAGYCGVYYCGVYSPAPAIIVMALYMNSLVGSVTYTAYVYVLCAALQAVLVGLVMVGAVEDRGLVTAEHMTLFNKVIAQGIIQSVLLATFLIARFSRRETMANFERLETAVRAVAQREVLLKEARQELERAGWAGNAGRFTDQRVGSYVLGMILGRGAMGEVYEAVHMTSGATAAIKLLHRNVLEDPEQVARFAREAAAIGNIDSLHVVRVLEVGGDAEHLPYMAMERLEGNHLGHELQAKRRLELRDVVELVRQVGEGIDAAHAAGVVHRDLKPQNLFSHQVRGQPPIWKILDFGVSKVAEHSGTLTQGQAIGTPSYMAPEQARGQPVNHQADIYSLGAIAYRALTGHPAFSGADVPTILHDVVFRVPTRPGALIDVPDDVDAVLALALAKNREQRFATGAAFAEAITAAARGTLSPALRQQASRLIGRYPWGRALR